MLFEKIKLEDDEQILTVVRRHWFVFLLRLFSVVALTAAPFVLFVAAAFIDPIASIVTTASADYSDQIIFVSMLWLLFGWMGMAHAWTDQYLDLWVVTDRRIISIDQKNLFVRSVGSFRLERLQDMNIIIPGFVATLLDYGHVEAQTASGSEEEFQVQNLPHPRELKALILEAADTRMRYVNDRTSLTEGT